MVTTLAPEPVCSVGAEHGECPVWNAEHRRLDWTDLAAAVLHRFDPATGGDETISVGSPLGSFAPRRSGGYVLATARGFEFLDLGSGNSRVVATIDPGEGPEVRFNDGKCDPGGRFIAGTMALDVAPGRGALYRLDPDLSVTTLLTGATICNGLDWSADGKTFFWIDSLNGQSVFNANDNGVDAFDYDAGTGSISNRRRVLPIANDRTGPAWQTIPDGMTLDEDGFLWVAIAGGREVRRYAPSGELDTVVELPVWCPTSVCFGGDDLRDLYITSMTLETGVPEEYRRHEAFAQDRPLEGALFRCRTRVAGRPTRDFAG
jgi:sugar lactone lactonase YvrE